MTPLCVLHVDDDSFARALIEATLDDAGYHVQSVGSAHAALAAAEETDFDLYLIDLGLPEMRGTELAETLVQEIHEAPVLFVTGLPDEAPADASVVAKPFSGRELLDAIEATIADRATR